MLNTEVHELFGDEALEAIAAEDRRTGERQVLAARALFVFIGMAPCTSWLGDMVDVDDYGLSGALSGCWSKPAPARCRDRTAQGRQGADVLQARFNLIWDLHLTGVVQVSGPPRALCSWPLQARRMPARHRRGTRVIPGVARGTDRERAPVSSKRSRTRGAGRAPAEAPLTSPWPR